MFPLHQFKQCWREQKPATAESGAARSHHILREKQESAAGTACQEVTEETAPDLQGMSACLSLEKWESAIGTACEEVTRVSQK